MKLKEEDCILFGFGSGRHHRYSKAVHHPTGATVEFANLITKREIMKALQSYVDTRLPQETE